MIHAPMTRIDITGRSAEMVVLSDRTMVWLSDRLTMSV